MFLGIFFTNKEHCLINLLCLWPHLKTLFMFTPVWSQKGLPLIAPDDGARVVAIFLKYSYTLPLNCSWWVVTIFLSTDVAAAVRLNLQLRSKLREVLTFKTPAWLSVSQKYKIRWSTTCTKLQLSQKSVQSEDIYVNTWHHGPSFGCPSLENIK